MDHTLENLFGLDDWNSEDDWQMNSAAGGYWDSGLDEQDSPAARTARDPTPLHHMPNIYQLPSSRRSPSPPPRLLQALLSNRASAVVTFPARQQLETQASEEAAHRPAEQTSRGLVASHRDDWLDPRPVEAVQETTPERLFRRAFVEDQVSRASTAQDLYSPTPHREAFDEDTESDTMPAQTCNTRRESVVESLGGSTAHSATKRKRRVGSSSDLGGSASKRRKSTRVDLEEVDLTDEAPSAEEELLKVQRREAIESQQSGQESGSQTIGKRSCVICMDNFTDITTTICGHFYCHECLVRSLMSAEKNTERGTGNCPICRKHISRTNKKHIVPVSFMKQAQFERNNRKRENA